MKVDTASDAKGRMIQRHQQRMARYKAKCDAGDVLSCGALGVEYHRYEIHRAHGVEYHDDSYALDQDKAKALLEPACNAPDGAAYCGALAETAAALHDDALAASAKQKYAVFAVQECSNVDGEDTAPGLSQCNDLVDAKLVDAKQAEDIAQKLCDKFENYCWYLEKAAKAAGDAAGEAAGHKKYVTFVCARGRADEEEAEENDTYNYVTKEEIAACHEVDAAAAGCTKDTDCKGDRVCNAGACVEPAKK